MIWNEQQFSIRRVTKKEIVKQPDFSWQFVSGTIKCSYEKPADKLKPKVSEAFLTCSFLQISPKASSEHLQCTFDNSGANFCLKVQNEPKTFLKSFFFLVQTFSAQTPKNMKNCFKKIFPNVLLDTWKTVFTFFCAKPVRNSRVPMSFRNKSLIFHMDR